MGKPINILVTGAGAAPGTAAVRLCKSLENLNAFAIDMRELSVGRIFAKEFATVPPVSAESYAQAMRDRVSAWEIDVVLPTVDQELPHIRAALKGLNTHVALSPQKSIELCNDKHATYTYLAPLIPEAVPQYQSADEVLQIIGEQFFLKPKIGSGARGCRTITQWEAEHIAQIVHRPVDWLIMPELPGTEWTVDSYVSHDVVQYLVPRTRSVTAGGLSLSGATIKNDYLMALARKIIKTLKWYGPIHLQFKEDHNGVPYLTEINARLSGGSMITFAAGINPLAHILADYWEEAHPSAEWVEITALGYVDYRVL